MMLLDYLRVPSAFEDDPWGYARNQVGHAAIGAVLVWYFGWPALGVIAIGYAALETVQWRKYGGQDWDALQDLAFVTLTAILPMQPAVIAPMVFYLLAGWLRRYDVRLKDRWPG